MIRWFLATTCLLTSGAALAQEAPPADESAEQQAGIQDIVVTASRREEIAQRSALSIQAISSEELARRSITRPEDLNAIAPGVSIASGGNYPQTYIRGVGNYATNNYAEGAVAYNIDGVYISRGWATRAALFDLDRVEVLKGPQGTLYGRNASGGAINIITARPKLGETSGFVEGEVGNYALWRGAAAINLPIGDTLALRASGQITHRDGYLSDGYDDDKSGGARLHLFWEPSSDVSLLLSGSYQRVGGKGAGSVVNPSLPGSRWRGPSDPAVVNIVRNEAGIGGLLVGFGADGYANIDVYSISGELRWDLGPATLTVIPAYRDSKLSDRTYVPGFQVDNNEHDQQTSLEVRVSNESDALKWVVGGYYFNEDQSNIAGHNLLFVSQGVNAQTVPNFASKTRSYAVFGQATFSISDKFRLTGGLRYTYERKQQGGLTSSYGFPNAAPPVCTDPAVFDPATPSQPLFCRLDVRLGNDETYKSWTWKGGFEFDVGPASLLYGNVSTGFKSGGFFAAPTPNTFRPERLTAFDIGVKNRFFDNRLQLNVEAFYWQYRDHQESHLAPTSAPGFFTFVTENAGLAKSYGADIDLQFQPDPNNNFTLKLQYNKSKYDSFLYTHPTAVFGPPTTGCAVSAPANGSQEVDCSGFQLVRSPTWTGTASYSRTFELGGGDKITAGISGQFASSSFLSIDFIPTTKQDSYVTLDADLGYTTKDGRFSVNAYVRNITQQGVLTQAFHYPFVSPANTLADPGGLVLASIRPPRTFGARARYSF